MHLRSSALSSLFSALVIVAAGQALAQSKDAGAPVATPPAPTAAVTVKDGIATPESVFYDAETDTWLVSNINGAPLAKDNNGYVTELKPDGTVVAAKLVAGGEKGITLNAPKGLVVHGGFLYVADIDTVRLFDRKTGAAKGEVKVAGSTFVNDLALGPDGRIYLTDSGLNEKFEPTGTDGLYVIVPGKKPVLKTLLKSKSLNKPNGLTVTKDAIFVVCFGAAELQKYSLAGKLQGEPTKLPKGSLDGVFMVGDDFIISSWEGAALYRGAFGGEFKEIASNLKAPADIGFDSKRNLILVPRFQDNLVEAWPLK